MEGQETTNDKQKRYFGDTFEQFGEQMAAWGQEFGRQMEAWGQEFENRMAVWGQDFGPRMEVWAEELAQHMEQVGERFEQWFEREMVTPAASAEDQQKSRLAILRMLEEGKISVAEAESLLQAVGK